jgi:hypothetical protein
LTDQRHTFAVGALTELVELYDDATNTVRTLAADLRIPLPANLYGPSSC